MASLSNSYKIGLRVPAGKKAQFAALAAAQGLSQARLLAQLIDHVLDLPSTPPDPTSSCGPGRCTDRVTLRLRPGDRDLVTVRAAARGMKTSTYLVALVHAHVRGEAPLPVHEINWLKACVGELSALVRTLQSLRSASGVPASAGPDGAVDDLLLQSLRSADQIRQAMADLVRANLVSWEGGHG